MTKVLIRNKEVLLFIIIIACLLTVMTNRVNDLNNDKDYNQLTKTLVVYK